MEAFVHRWMITIITALILLSGAAVSPKEKNLADQVKMGFGVGRHLTAHDIDKARERAEGRCDQEKVVNAEEFEKVLRDHEAWLNAYHDGSSKEAMSDSRRAHLDCVNLSEDQMGRMKMIWGEKEVNLSGALLRGSNWSGVDLSKANLSGAFLRGANLSGALLRDANLSGALLRGANLSNAVFELKDLPDVDEIAYAKNLSQMHYKQSPQGLVKLRKAFKEGGYYQPEREITYAIQHTETLKLFDKKTFPSSFEAMFRYLFFDLTCQWGMVPGRALLILLTLIPVFAIPYVIALRLRGQDGIWRRWADDRIRFDLGTKNPIRLHPRWLHAPALGFYFSVLSAFNIGWREFNVGNWIQRLQAKEYTLKATGWVRVVSGVQSLISAYLLAIWALTYFGRPFE